MEIHYVKKLDMDKYKIDGHKLNYHINRLNDWLEGRVVYPIYAEIAPSGTCNHRCTFCALDYVEYQKRFLERELLLERLAELAQRGLKSVMYAGEGEPLLHPEIGDIVVRTKRYGIDVALTTNGVKLHRELIEQCLDCIAWIKVSINAGTPETYSKIHKASPKHFEVVLENLAYAGEFRKKKGCDCALGVQILLLPENASEVATLAQRVKDIGLDYLVVKPYSQHPMSKTRLYENFRYNDYLHLKEKLRGLSDNGFQVIFRERTMKKWDEGHRTYEQCLALPFWSYVDAGGNVWGCSAYLGDKRFLYGNIYKNMFSEIWEGELRKKSLLMVETELDTSSCRVNCRMDEINRFLWDLKNPPPHVNFI